VLATVISIWINTHIFTSQFTCCHTRTPAPVRTAPSQNGFKAKCPRKCCRSIESKRPPCQALTYYGYQSCRSATGRSHPYSRSYWMPHRRISVVMLDLTLKWTSHFFFFLFFFFFLLCMQCILCIKSHNWSAKRWLNRQQSVAETSSHLTASEDKSRQCGTLFVCHRRDTNQWLPDSITSYRHHSDPVQAQNSSADTIVVVKGFNPVVGLWGHSLGKHWPHEPTSSFLSIDLWFPKIPDPATEASWMGDRNVVGWWCLNVLASCHVL